VDELNEFGTTILLVSIGLSVAIAVRVLADRMRIPAAALILVGTAALSDVFEGLYDAVRIVDVQRVATVALIVILFDGGMHIGWRRFRAAAVPVASLGVVGTFATAALVAVAAHEFLDVSWVVAGLIGAAVAPTDPAVTFAVLGGREIRGRAGTIVEGESGFNDPVGIALMIGMVEYATADDPSVGPVTWEFLRQLGLGLAVGAAGGVALLWLMRRLPLPDVQLYPIGVLGFAGVLYGLATVVDGSGFLAVFVAGILVGDAAAPHKGEIERFHSSLANLAETAAFIALGLTVDLGFITDEGLWLDGILLAAVLTLLVRPLVVGGLLLPVRLTWGERGFVVWSGLKGAVPILLASLAVVSGTEYARQIYGIVFVVVLVSVVVQGTGVPFVADALRVPMRPVSPETMDARRVVVAPGALANGRTLAELPLAERAWVSEIDRDGRRVHVGGATRLEPGDEVVVFCDEPSEPAIRRIFEGRELGGTEGSRAGPLRRREP
jgi:potassium/hydrogen antiporter